jgi:4-hydroxybenzoate polyprenyltransferase
MSAAPVESSRPSPDHGGAQAPSWADSFRAAASDIKLAHSVFALPFAVLGAFLARDPARPWREFAIQLVLVVACMVCARTWAMMVNRLADRRFDAMNPRTTRRALASGRLPLFRAAVMTTLAAALFVCSCVAFDWLFTNPWPTRLCVPVLGWIAFYSFTKRFTALCHVFLGGALAISPLAAAIAVRPGAVMEHAAFGAMDLGGFGTGVTIAALAVMVLCWVAGFDIIYALQDVDFDRAQGLRSIPSRLGPARGAWVSRGLHTVSFGALMVAAASDWRFGAVFDSAVGLVGVLLVAEHVVLAVRGKAGLEMAFFTLNGVVSCLLGAAGVVDLTLI